MQQNDILTIKQLVDEAKTILIIQADNPDGDSLASSLALEQILHKLGKEPIMYCGVDMPSYLRYLSGWDRVSNELPTSFDMSIIVDTSSVKLLEKLGAEGKLGWLGAKPCVVLDHHQTTEASDKIEFATAYINDSTVSSTGELLYKLAKQTGWDIDNIAGEFIMTAILSDSQGLTNSLATAETYRVMAELTEAGVDRPLLEEKRREFGKMTQAIFRYKAELIARTQFASDGRIAYLAIPQKEIIEYSPQYNPAPLIQPDILQTEGVAIAIVFKQYDGGRVTAAIRCNNGFAIGDKLAEHFGGGGHAYASGFKKTDGTSLEAIQAECIKYATTLLDNLDKE